MFSKKSLLWALAVLPLSAGVLAGCGSDGPPPIPKEQIDEIRHPTHVPPPDYKPDTRGGEGPPPSTNPSSGG